MPVPATDAREYDQIEGISAPEETRSLIGHADARAQILSAFEADRLHHAFLLEGPRGIGKATFAFDIARRLLALSGGESPARVFAQVANGAHPNLAVVRRRRNEKTANFYSEIVIADIRELIGEFRHTAGHRGLRIALIDAIEDMGAGAANALLKTLEEPPDNALFLLVTHRPGLVIPTIRSRSRTMSLRPLEKTEVRDVLKACGLAAEPAEIDQAASLAAGVPRKAIEALVLGQAGALGALAGWLDAAETRRGSAHLEIAADLSRGATGGYGIAVDMISGWISARTRQLAVAGSGRNAPLALLAELWDKAHALASDQATYNLDRRQTLVMMLDAIRDFDDRI